MCWNLPKTLAPCSTGAATFLLGLLILILAAGPARAADPDRERGEGGSPQQRLNQARELLAGLKDQDGEGRRQILELLEDLASEAASLGAVPMLMVLVRSDPQTAVREQALRLLGAIGPQAANQVIPVCLDLLDIKKHAPGRVRGWAAYALGKMKPPVKLVAKRLVPLLLYPDDFLQAAVRGALLDLDDKVLPLLLVLLIQSKDAYPRQKLAQAIGSFGPRAEDLVDDLLRLRESEKNERVREALLDAVFGILPAKSPQAVRLVLAELPRATGYQRYRFISGLGELGPAAAEALPELRRALNDEDEDVRSVALGAIGQIVTPETGEDLVDEVAGFLEGSYWMATKASAALARMGPGGEAILLKATGHAKARVRKFAWQGLAKLPPGPVGHVEALAVRLDAEADPLVREAVAQALARHREAAVFALTDALSREPDARVRAALAGELGRCGPKALDALTAALGDSSDDVRRAAANGLGELGPAAASAVPALLAIRGGYVISDEIKAVEKIGTAALPGLVQGLASEDPKTRAQAAYAFGLLGAKAASQVESLARVLSDPDKEVRQWAAWSVGHLGPDADYAVEDLQAALTDPEPEVRENAARALGKLGSASAQAIPDLIAALGDRERSVAGKAAESLADLGPLATRAVPKLIETLAAHEQESARREAAKALGLIGVRESAVRDALLAALKDEKARVRWAAGEALLRVGKPAHMVEARRVIRAAPDEAAQEDARVMREFGRMLHGP